MEFGNVGDLICGLVVGDGGWCQAVAALGL